MKDGFIKVAAASICTSLADPKKNSEKIINTIKQANELGVKLIAFSELSVTGANCGNLYLNDTLLKGTLNALQDIVCETKGMDITAVVGAPISFSGKIFNCAVVINDGEILGAVPSNLKNDIFSSDYSCQTVINILDEAVPFGCDLIFRHTSLESFAFTVGVGENAYLSNGAPINVHIAASAETLSTEKWRSDFARVKSKENIGGYIYASCGEGESTADEVYSGQLIIAENGKLLNEVKPFDDKKLCISEIDVSFISYERRKEDNCYTDILNEVFFDCQEDLTVLTRKIKENPFIPEDKEELHNRCETALNIQSRSLAKRISHTGAKSVVIGISGGLDSTLALIVCARAMDILNRPHSDVIAVTMPCFGTTNRTKSNATSLCNLLGVTFMEIDISDSVRSHFSDIGHDESIADITYENAQARERTQVLMDLSNRFSGFVVGTGDLSELALGWATYNGDHMSMYGVNSSVPKTFIKEIVRFFAINSEENLKAVLLDILDTPVSPELLPADKEGEISQKTEDLVGPYELHDFFIYYFCRCGFSPSKIYRLALYALSHKYSDETIKKWLKNFVKRFFTQQFKRSCLPDGAKIGSVCLSGREYRMPSDALYSLWYEEAESL